LVNKKLIFISGPYFQARVSLAVIYTPNLILPRPSITISSSWEKASNGSHIDPTPNSPSPPCLCPLPSAVSVTSAPGVLSFLAQIRYYHHGILSDFYVGSLSQQVEKMSPLRLMFMLKRILRHVIAILENIFILGLICRGESQTSPYQCEIIFESHDNFPGSDLFHRPFNHKQQTGAGSPPTGAPTIREKSAKKPRN
jgi:hypothetical protein